MAPLVRPLLCTQTRTALHRPAHAGESRHDPAEALPLASRRPPPHPYPPLLRYWTDSASANGRRTFSGSSGPASSTLGPVRECHTHAILNGVLSIADVDGRMPEKVRMVPRQVDRLEAMTLAEAEQRGEPNSPRSSVELGWDRSRSTGSALAPIPSRGCPHGMHFASGYDASKPALSIWGDITTLNAASRVTVPRIPAIATRRPTPSPE